MENDEENDLPLVIRLIVFAIQVALVILFIAFTIITLGIFLPDDSGEKTKEQKKTPSIEEKLRVQLERKRNRLNRVRNRIVELQGMLKKIRATEQRILFSVRVLILSLVVLGNWYYLSRQEVVLSDFIPGSKEGQHTFVQVVDLVTGFNALILLTYSIPGYLLYGTVGRFTSAMKAKTVSILRRKHIPSFSELQLMREEEKQLLQEINYLKMRLEEFEL